MAAILVTHPPVRGVQWLREAVLLFRAQPMPLMAVAAFALLALTLVSVVPVLGQWVGFMALPLLGQAFVQAVYQIKTGVPVRLSILWEPFNSVERRREVIRMALIFAAGLMLFALIARWVDGGAMFKLQTVMLDESSTDAQRQAAMGQPGLFSGFFTQVVLFSLWSTLFCFVPALILWQRQSLAQALFSNLLGLWRNKWPLTVFMLAYALLSMTVMMAILLLTLLLGSLAVTMLLVLILSLPMMVLLYLGLGVMYRDCFVAKESAL